MADQAFEATSLFMGVLVGQKPLQGPRFPEFGFQLFGADLNLLGASRQPQELTLGIVSHLFQCSHFDHLERSQIFEALCFGSVFFDHVTQLLPFLSCRVGFHLQLSGAKT